MPLLDLIVRNSLENPAVPISSAEVLKVLGMTSDSVSGIAVNPQKALGLTPLWRGVNVLSSDVAKIPLEILRRQEDGGKERATEHPAYPLLRRRPNESLTAFHFKKTLMVHALLRGNGYAGIRRDSLGAPFALIILPPTPETTPLAVDGALWYVGVIDGRDFRLPAADVLHIRGLSWDGLEGLDVVSVLCDALGLELGQRGHAARFFRHGTQLPGFLVAPGRLDDKEVNRIRENWNTMQTGIESMHKVGLLWGGLDFKSLGIDPQKSQLLESRQLGMIEIANVLNLPPHKVGHPARTSYNSLEMENADHLSTSLDPWLVAIEEECAEKLLTDEDRADGLLVEFNRLAILRVDYGTRVAGYAKMREMGVMNANQVSAAENLPSQGPQGDRYFVPANWTAVGDDGLPVVQAGGQGSGVRSQGSSPQIIAAHRAAILDRADQLWKFELRSVERAAEKEADFAAWLDRFYATHEPKLAEALGPAVAACAAAIGAGDPTLTVTAAVRSYVRSSRQKLAALATELSGPALAAAIRANLAHWHPTPEALADWIISHI